MSLNRMINPDNVYQGPGAVQPEAPGMFDIARAGYRAQLDNYNTNSRDSLIDEGRAERDKKFKEITGNELTMELSKEFTWQDPVVAQLRNSGPGNRQDTYETRQRMEYYKDLHIKELRAKDPNLYNVLQTQEEIEQSARKKARLSSEEFSRLSELSSSRGKISAAKGYAAGFAGQVAGSIVDPFNIATMAITSGAGMLSKNVLQQAGKTTFQSVLKVAGQEALENVAQEVITAPAVSKWQKELGAEYGLEDFVTNVAAAGVLGGTLGGVTEGAMPSARWLWGKLRESKASSAAVKKASSIMERISHLKENNPFLKGREPKGIHDKGIAKATQALVEGRSLAVDEIMPESTFLAQDTNIGEAGSVVAKGTAKDIEDIRGSVLNQTIESEEFLDKLSPQRLREIGQASEEGKLWRVHIEKEDGSHVVMDAIGSKSEARAQVESLHLKDGDFTTGVDPVRMKISERAKGTVKSWDGSKGVVVSEGKEIPFQYRDLETVPEVGQDVHFDPVEGEAHKISARSKEKDAIAINENLEAKRVVDTEIQTMIEEGSHKGMTGEQAAAALTKGSGKRYEKLVAQATERLSDGYMKEGRFIPPNGEFFRAQDAAQEFVPDRFDSGRSYSPDNQLAEDIGMVLPESPSQKIQRQYIESYNSESVIKAEQSNFDRLLKENAEMQITLEDGKVVTIKELAESFKDDERAHAAMQSCSI